MIRRYVPTFDGCTDKQQIDFIVRTQEKINKIRDAAEDLINHLEYAAPNKHKAIPPLKDPQLNVRAAVLTDVMCSTRRAGELLGVALPRSDQDRRENQTIRRMAKLGHELLHGYFGEAEWKTMVERMREHRRWWEQWEALDEPRVQFYALLAKARGTSPKQERLDGEGNGFDKKLEKWVTIAEQYADASDTFWQSKDEAEQGDAARAAKQALREKLSTEDSDERFSVALSLLEEPPPGQP
jgi:hypothetical protein